MAEDDQASANAVKNKARRRVNKLNPVRCLAYLLNKTSNPPTSIYPLLFTAKTRCHAFLLAIRVFVVN